MTRSPTAPPASPRPTPPSPSRGTRSKAARAAASPARRAPRPGASTGVAGFAPAAAPGATKGELTRALILDAALQHASVHGFEALTIGSLAERTGLSKSGLFAHFGSKEDLQIATLDEAARRYQEAAILPALRAPRGLARLKALFEHWLDWTARSALTSCPMMAAAGEFDRRDGPMRDAVEGHLRRLHQETARSVTMVVANGEFRLDTDAEQFAFELFGIIATYYRSRNLFRDPAAATRARAAFARLVADATPPARAAQRAR